MENPFRRWGAFGFERLLPKKPPIVNAISRASARLRCRTIPAKSSRQRRGRSPDAFAEPVLERLLVAKPRRKGTVRESVRQQADQSLHDFGCEFSVELRTPDCVAQGERPTGGLRVVRQRPRVGHDATPGARHVRERVLDVAEPRSLSPFAVRYRSSRLAL